MGWDTLEWSPMTRRSEDYGSIGVSTSIIRSIMICFEEGE
jgi:hypothetical protein